MDEVTSSIATETTDNSGTDTGSQASAPQASGQTPVTQGTPTPDSYNPKWYETDGRKGKMWKSADVRDDITKSYYHLEPKYKEATEELNRYKTTFKKTGMELEKFPEWHQEYQTLKDPKNPVNTTYAYMSELANDPIYGPQLKAQLEQIEVAKLQQKYPNMNRAQIEKQMEMEQYINQDKQEKQKASEEKYLESFTSQIAKQVDKNKSLASSVGMEYTADMHKEVLAIMAKFDEENGYPITAHEAFLQIYGEQVDKARTQKLEADFIKRQQAKVNSGTPARSGKPSTANMTLSDKLRKTFAK